MKYVRDNEESVHVMHFDSVDDIVESTEDCLGQKTRTGLQKHRFSVHTYGWLGRSIYTWEQVKAACFDPEPDVLESMESIVERLKKHDLPEPKSRRRRRIWSDSSGSEVCSNRWMSGEPYWRSMQKGMVNGPANVTLLTNLDGSGDDSPEEIAWRGAGAVVIADILEQSGYNVEMLMWNKGDGVFNGNIRGQFTTVRMKEFGAFLDIGGIMNVLSGWFLRAVVFNSFNNCPVGNNNLGSVNKRLGKCDKHLDIGSDTRVVYMPFVRSEDGAVGAVNQVLRQFELVGDESIGVSEWEEVLGV